MFAAFFSHWFHTFYVPSSGPWYGGQVWGNVFVVAVIAPLGWLWSRTRFFPLRPIQHGLTALHAQLDAHHAHNRWMAQAMRELHLKTDGEPPAEQHPHFDL